MRMSRHFLAVSVTTLLLFSVFVSVAAASIPDWTGETLPRGVSERRVAVDGLQTRLLEAGPRRKREAVVYLSGFPGSSLDYVDLERTSGEFMRSVAFDFPGFGEASKPAGRNYSAANQARFIDAMLNRLGIRRAHLVMHDFGGFYGLEWASQNLSRVESVVLIDAGVLKGYTGHEFALLSAAPVVGEAYNGIQTRESFGQGLNDRNPKPLPSSFIDRMYEDYDGGARQTAPAIYRGIGQEIFTIADRQAAALAGNRLPALVIWGREDPYIPARFAARQREVFPRARVHVLPAVGHFPFIDEVVRVRRLVRPFLRKAQQRPVSRSRNRAEPSGGQP